MGNRIYCTKYVDKLTLLKYSSTSELYSILELDSSMYLDHELTTIFTIIVYILQWRWRGKTTSYFFHIKDLDQMT
ncbi:hypothetical protein Glove_641g16 [Diversispora epigaea]|uniref:Uncharacterized protein n=1 Tax=Diversispora epigaea TaxID=1348612 RepID=A0A397G7W9_9GLOM|nr:hypothetical protein Glove_641g16 [Diversispora epigaea]